MPLSEDEQRILHEIEQKFYAQDPDSAKRIRSTTLPRYLARNCWWAALGFLIGVGVLLASFATSLVLGVFGFLIMLGSAFIFAHNLRRMGRHGWQQLTSSLRSRDVPGMLGETQRRLRRRLGRDE